MEQDFESSFDAFLNDIQFPRIFPEIRAMTLRSIWSIRDLPLKTILKELYGPEFRQFPTAADSDLFASMFSKLWESLLKHQNEGVPFRFFPFPTPRNLRDIQSRVYVRNLEIQALQPLLHDDRVLPEYQPELTGYTDQIICEVEKLHLVFRETITPDPASPLDGWVQSLDAIDAALEEPFNRVGWLFMRIRREHPELKSFAIVKGPQPGRNDPCPCGSGKKYKQCCLGKT